jgi:hypothetical protein
MSHNLCRGIFPDLDEISGRLVGEHMKQLPCEVADVQVVRLVNIGAPD